MLLTQNVTLILFVSLSFICCVRSDIQNNNWDFLELVSQWPGSSCLNRKCNFNINEIHWWTLHGLWPLRNDGTWPQFCPGDKFNITNIDNLINTMNKLWPTYFSGSNIYLKVNIPTSEIVEIFTSK
jgi:ribonuclease T2